MAAQHAVAVPQAALPVRQIHDARFGAETEQRGASTVHTGTVAAHVASPEACSSGERACPLRRHGGFARHGALAQDAYGASAVVSVQNKQTFPNQQPFEGVGGFKKIFVRRFQYLATAFGQRGKKAGGHSFQKVAHGDRRVGQPESLKRARAQDQTVGRHMPFPQCLAGSEGKVEPFGVCVHRGAPSCRQKRRIRGLRAGLMQAIVAPSAHVVIRWGVSVRKERDRKRRKEAWGAKSG